MPGDVPGVERTEAWTREECLAEAPADDMDYWFCTGDGVVDVSPEIEPAPESEADLASAMGGGGENVEAPPTFAARSTSTPGSPECPACGPLRCKEERRAAGRTDALHRCYRRQRLIRREEGSAGRFC